jgi:hypothetical protein
MTGRIDRTHGINPAWEIQVDGYREMRYMDYTKAQAIREYRRQHNLTGKHISWRDYTRPDMPQNLFDAYMAYLKA